MSAKAKEAGLTLNGKPLIVGGLPPGKRKVAAVLDKCKHNQVFTSEQTAAMAGLSIFSLRTHAKPPDKYRQQLGQKMLYGHPKAIERLRKKMSEAQKRYEPSE